MFPGHCSSGGLAISPANGQNTLNHLSKDKTSTLIKVIFSITNSINLKEIWEEYFVDTLMTLPKPPLPRKARNSNSLCSLETPRLMSAVGTPGKSRAVNSSVVKKDQRSNNKFQRDIYYLTLGNNLNSNTCTPSWDVLSLDWYSTGLALVRLLKFVLSKGKLLGSKKVTKDEQIQIALWVIDFKGL